MTASSEPDAMLREAGAVIENFAPSIPPRADSIGGDAGQRRNGREHPDEQMQPPPLKLVNPATLEGLHVPDRRWIVQDWLPAPAVTSLYGDGGVGKTLLAQQLMTSCATGRPWAGLAVERCHSLALFCEDDENELHRRQDAINQALGVRFADLGDMRWHSGVGADNLLMLFDGPRGAPSRRFLALEEAAKNFGARLVVIDTAADTFGGNENDRAQVRQFIGHALNRLASTIDGAVLLCAHPSRSGLGTGGDLDGGSTGWSNSVRSRWSLTRPTDEDVEKSTPERILTRRKANYASIGDEIRLTWDRGFLAPITRPSHLAQMSRDQEADHLFLKMLDACTASNLPVSHVKNAANWAPRLFAKRPGASGLTARNFEAAMHRLLADGQITLLIYGRKGDQRRRIGRIEVPPAVAGGPEP